MTPVPLLEVRNLTKRFGPLLANDKVSLSIKQGEIHAIVGENGAGKSTLMKCIYGMYNPTEGDILVSGKKVRIDSPNTANRFGIGMVHQHFMLLPSFPVYRNIVLGAEPRKGILFDEDKALTRVEEISQLYGLEIDARAVTRNLPVGLQQKVEILKLLYREADLLIFDEPTAVLSPTEIEGLFTILRRFREKGKTILFIAHKLAEVMAIADRISVLRGGRLVGTVPVDSVTERDLARMMVGRDLASPSPRAPSDIGETVLETKNLSVRGNRDEWSVGNVSLKVGRGEILGIAGVMGNGQSELEETLAGLRLPAKGHVFYEEKNITNLSVRKRRDMGMAYIPEDRMRTGLAPLGRLWENLIMGHQEETRFSEKGFLHHGPIKDFSREMLTRFQIVAPGEMVQAGTLSGGNMQKVLLAREMIHEPKFLLVCQPTRGVDVGGIAFIHRMIMEQRAHGVAILLVSSDLDEILNLSDRVGVMFRGRLVTILDRAEATRERVGRFMLTGTETQDQTLYRS